MKALLIVILYCLGFIGIYLLLLYMVIGVCKLVAKSDKYIEKMMEQKEKEKEG